MTTPTKMMLAVVVMMMTMTMSVHAQTNDTMTVTNDTMTVQTGEQEEVSVTIVANDDSGNSIAFPPLCDGCFCVPDEAGGECPSTMPRTKYDFDLTDNLKDLSWTNPITLDCNPYEDPEGCTVMGTTPADNAGDGPDAVCGLIYNKANADDACPSTYSTQTFASRSALEEGYIVTHNGACGACSSLQDLAIYITTPDLSGAGTKCGYLSLTNETAALECYQDIGFSVPCSAVWLYNTGNTRVECLGDCLAYLNKPPNLMDVDMCPLNECILCDEANSGPIFKKIAGRTRRNSGLLGMIIRNCSEIVYDVVQEDPCPTGTIPTPAPTMAATESGTGIWQPWSVVAAVPVLAMTLSALFL